MPHASITTCATGCSRRNRSHWDRVTAEEVDWRPLTQANSINLIVRHLCIEAQWHRASLEHGESMPHEATEDLRRQIDVVPLEFERNLKALEKACAGFVAAFYSQDVGFQDVESRDENITVPSEFAVVSVVGDKAVESRAP